MHGERNDTSHIADFVQTGTERFIRPLANLNGLEQDDLADALGALPIGTRLLYETHGLVEQSDSGSEHFDVTALEGLPVAIDLAAKRFPSTDPNS